MAPAQCPATRFSNLRSLRVSVSCGRGNAVASVIAILITSALPAPCAADAQGPSAESSLYAASEAANLRGNYDEAARGLISLLGAVRPGDSVNIALLLRLGTIHEMRGRYRDAEAVLARARQGAERVYGTQDAITGTISLMLGNVYQEQGRYAEAENAYQSALQILQAAYGQDHPAVAECIVGLAETSRRQGRIEESQRRFWRAYMLSTYLYGGDSSRVGALLVRLARVYAQQGLSKDAEGLVRRALTIGDRPLQTSAQWGRLEDRDLLLLLPAEREFSAAKGRITYRTRDGEHPQYARYFDSLGELYLTAGQYAKAEHAYRRSIAIRERSFDRDHPEIAAATTGLGAARALAGDLPGALELTRGAADSLIRRIDAYPLADSSYAQGERRRWRPTFLQLLSLLSGGGQALGNHAEEAFRTMQYAMTLDVGSAAHEVSARRYPGDVHPTEGVAKEFGTQAALTIAEVQALLADDEALLVQVQDDDELYAALIQRSSITLRSASADMRPRGDALTLLSDRIAGLRKLSIVSDRPMANVPYVVLPSVAALRAFRE
jgi:tetratricopeptide (TPR) repeat protein